MMQAGMDGGRGRELLPLPMAASSECSSGCQSGWTTYLDDDDDDDRSSSRSCGTARVHVGKALYHRHHYCDYSEEDDLSMVSDASSGPRQQNSAGNDVEATGGAAGNSAAHERRGRRVDAASATRRQSKKQAAAAAVSLLEDTASSPAFFGYSKATTLLGETNGYGDGHNEAMMLEMGDAADFSCAFSATTGFKSPLNGTALDGFLQMQYSPAAAKTMIMPTRQVCRDAGETKRW